MYHDVIQGSFRIPVAPTMHVIKKSVRQCTYQSKVGQLDLLYLHLHLPLHFALAFSPSSLSFLSSRIRTATDPPPERHDPKLKSRGQSLGLDPYVHWLEVVSS